jgi:hypothetical protein
MRSWITGGTGSSLTCFFANSCFFSIARISLIASIILGFFLKSENVCVEKKFPCNAKILIFAKNVTRAKKYTSFFKSLFEFPCSKGCLTQNALNVAMPCTSITILAKQ